MKRRVLVPVVSANLGRCDHSELMLCTLTNNPAMMIVWYIAVSSMVGLGPTKMCCEYLWTGVLNCPTVLSFLVTKLCSGGL